MTKADVFNQKSFSKFVETVKSLNEKSEIKTQWTCVDEDDALNAGIFHSPHGFSFRVAYIEKDRVYQLSASKRSYNLRGELSEDDVVRPTHGLVKESYPIAAFYMDDFDNDLDKVFLSISKAMNKFDAELFDRAGHTIHVQSSFSVASPFYHDIDHAYFGDGTDVMVNLKGYDVLRFDKDKNVIYHDVSVYRADGSFNDVDYKGRLFDGVSHATHVVAEDDHYLSMRFQMDQERRAIDQSIWEQWHLHKKTGGGAFTTKASMYSLFNYVHHNLKVVATNAVVCAGVYLKDPHAGWKFAAISTAAHFAMHESTNEFFSNFKGVIGRIKNAYFGVDVTKTKPKGNIAYLYQEGGRNLLWGRHNTHKFAPHADLKASKVEDMRYINPDEIRVLAEKVAAVSRKKALNIDDLDDHALVSFLLKLHQKNLPMKANYLDRATRALEVDNKIALVAHKAKDRSVTLYALLNPALCQNKGLELPEAYERRFSQPDGDKSKTMITKIHAYRENGVWSINEGHIFQDRREAVKEINALLFKDQEWVHEEHRAPSRRSVLETFFPEIHPVEALPIDAEEKAKMKSIGAVTLPSYLAVLTEKDYNNEIDRIGFEPFSKGMLSEEFHEAEELITIDVDDLDVAASCGYSDPLPIS